MIKILVLVQVFEIFKHIRTRKDTHKIRIKTLLLCSHVFRTINFTKLKLKYPLFRFINNLSTYIG